MECDMREKDDSARGKILEAAKAEFMERGFAEASMRTIAERAGFTTGMLYSRFADKSEIFRELVYSGRLPQFFLSDVMDEDIVCPFGMEDKKLLLYDDFGCWDEGCYMGAVSKDVIRQMPKSN